MLCLDLRLTFDPARNHGGLDGVILTESGSKTQAPSARMQPQLVQPFGW